jgi:hypothetical protein
MVAVLGPYEALPYYIHTLLPNILTILPYIIRVDEGAKK